MRNFINLAAALTLALTPPLFPSTDHSVDVVPQGTTAAALLAEMSPVDRVGQLFLVTFHGPSAAPGTDIERLITQHHVGGVVLAAANENITDTANAPLQVLRLTNELQSAAVAAAASGRASAESGLPEATSPPFVPLFIAGRHEGDSLAYMEVRSGLTALPSAMAVGATWDPAQAEAMGAIAGRELAALGINLLIGPSLDVVDVPRPQGAGDLGTRTFGGDPFWVGVMGRAFIRGVHVGSGRQVAIAATHFPGVGGSERSLEQEVPTVRKSLAQLKQIELAPFVAVTRVVSDTVTDSRLILDTTATADALLTAHIRFQGFQGNIRQTTSPVSFDALALGELLAQLSPWREQGGLMVTDALGAMAVKRFYDPSLRTFNNRRIAREAFEAGNDLLMLSEFGLTSRQETETIIDTINFFVNQYQADPAFAQRVDEAVTRILSLKLRLYGQFDPERVVRPESGLEVIGRGNDQIRVLAQQAATLVGLTPEELAARVPEPPLPQERIVIFTDVRLSRQCVECVAFPVMDKRALERAIVQFYGPAASNQVREGNLQSFSFDDLAAYLAASLAPPPPVGEGTPAPEPLPVETALAQGDWIVFAMLNVTPEVPNSTLVSRFLAQRADLLRNKRVVVFGFDAPYYLDTTDLSKITAYYTLYSKVPAFVDTAARLLFRSVLPAGAPPVSVPGVNYELSRVTAPDPNQVIRIFFEPPGGAETATVQPLGFKVGDTFPLRTGVIYDHNGHPVPDGTVVRFMAQYEGDDLPGILEVTTTGGVAATTLPLNRTGVLQITAASEPATNSDRVQLNVQENVPAFPTVIVPTPTDTPTPLPPTDTPVPPTATPAPQATPTGGENLGATGRVAGRDFFMMFLGLVAALIAGYGFRTGEAPRTQRLRVALSGAIGVLVGYNYFALGLPGADLIMPVFGVWAASVFVVVGAALGLIAGWYGFVRSYVAQLPR